MQMFRRDFITGRSDFVDENVSSLGVHLSLSALAREFGIDRETLRKRLAAADVKPAGENKGNPLWRLRDVYQAVVSGPDSSIDPAALPPFQRKAHYQAKMEEVRYLEQCGELVPKIEMEHELSRVAKILVFTLDTLPDVLERGCSLQPPQVQAAIDICNKTRDEIAEALCAGDEDEKKFEN